MTHESQQPPQSLEDIRRVVLSSTPEEAIGFRNVIAAENLRAADAAFDRFLKDIVVAENGGLDLTLKTTASGRTAQMQLNRFTDTEGTVVTDLSFSAKGMWGNRWRLEQDTNSGLTMTAMTDRDGSLKPIVGDSNTDKEVAYWGSLIPGNLDRATKAKDGKPGLIGRLLGRE